MFAGLAFFGCWTWVLSCYSDLTVGTIKNIFIVAGILIIIAICEVVWEVKKGFKLLFALPKKILILCMNKIKLKKIERKLKKNILLTKKEIDFYKEYRTW